MRAIGLLFLWSTLVVAGAAQDTNFAVGPQYLITTDSTLFLHPIATPSMSLQPMPNPAAPAIETQPQSAITPTTPPSPPPADAYLPSVYWGETWVNHVIGAPEESVIEISSAEPLQPIPPSLFDPGVGGISNPQRLRQEGYGEPLGDLARMWKARKSSGRHVYTNDDLARPHGG